MGNRMVRSVLAQYAVVIPLYCKYRKPHAPPDTPLYILCVLILYTVESLHLGGCWPDTFDVTDTVN